MNTGWKIFLFAIGGLLVALLVVLGVTTGTEGQKMSNSGSTQVKAVAKGFSSVDITVYDGRDTLGSALIDLINDTVEDAPELSIWVKTKQNSAGAYYNKKLNDTAPYEFVSATPDALKKVPDSKTSDDYINPDAQFKGKVLKDANDNIVGIEFTQID